MKRLLLRLFLVSSVSGLGYVGVVQVKKGFFPQSDSAPVAEAPDTQPDFSSVRPIPLAGSENVAQASAEAPGDSIYGGGGSVGRPPRDLASESGGGGDRFLQTSGRDPLSDPQANPSAANGPAGETSLGEPDPAVDRFADGPGRAAGEPRPFAPDGTARAARPEPMAPARPLRGGNRDQQAGVYAPDSQDVSVGGPADADSGDRYAPVSTPRGGLRQIPPDGAGPAADNLFSGAAPGGNNSSNPANDQPAEGAAENPQPTAGLGRPGAQQLEGAQSPSLAIEKTAPAEIQVGKPATFVIKVRNIGTVVAHGVEIHDDIPQGTQLIGTKPAATQPTQGKLVWSLGTMKPGDQTAVEMQLMPTSEGEIGSLATVHFHAEASVRTRSTRPALKLQVITPQSVMIGENLTMKIRVSNPGSGTATGIVLTENVPAELKHAAGAELELEIGTLKPGESRELDLTLNAAQAGHIVNLLAARGDANLRSEDRAEFDVLAPGLKLGLTGPKRRYLERNATFTVSVSNPGTASAHNVELAATLPQGMKFVEANNMGQFDAASNTVYWSLEELPAQESGTVTVTATPQTPGELKMQVRGKAQQGLSDAVEENVLVEGLAAILFELVDVNDPIEVNGETTYEIRVINQGSKAASNIRIVALLPPELRPLGADGPVRHTVEGQRVLFEPLGQLAPKADTTYTIKARAMQAGDLRVRVQLMSDEIRTPITKEESTRIYADE